MTENQRELLTVIYNKLRFTYLVDEQLSFMLQLKQLIDNRTTVNLNEALRPMSGEEITERFRSRRWQQE